MKRLLLAVAAIALSSTAMAADLAPQAAEPISPVAPYSWTGFYAGVNAGYAFGASRDVKMSELYQGEDPDSDRYGSLSPKGAFGGVQAGYNWQTGNFVVGLEADIQGAGINDTASAVGANTEYYLKTKNQVNWFGTIRPRVGYALDNILIYATGGLAIGGVQVSQYYNDGGGYTAHGKKDVARVGYVLGAGIEYAFDDHWSAKLEYQYIDLGKSSVSATEIEGGGATDYTIHTKLRTDFQTVRLGVNYRF